MRHTVITFKIVVVVTMALFSLLLVAEVMARGGGGGGGGRGGRGHHGGHSRMGPARGGSFSARPRTSSSTTSRPTKTLRDTRRDPSRPVPDVPPKAVDEKRPDDLQRHKRRHDEIKDEHWDRYHDRHDRRVVGTVYRGDDFSTDYCEASVAVSGVTYYQCENTWYKRAYSGGDVRYIVVDAPARN